MNRYFALSCVVHGALALLLVLLLSPAVKDSKVTYTIDFIGSGKVISMQSQGSTAETTAPAKAEEPKSEVKKEISQPTPAPKAAETPKPDKKAYQSKEEISTKKKPQPKKKEKPAPLTAPSILSEGEATQKAVSSSAGAAGSGGANKEGEFEGGSVQTDFATFPYPWYITQVRNSLWGQWEKRRPAGVSHTTVITFAIARNGNIKDLTVQKSSGDDSFDFAAKSAVINSGPFPPLPMLYEKDELTVTLELKQEK